MKFQLMRSPDECKNYCTRFRGEISRSKSSRRRAASDGLPAVWRGCVSPAGWSEGWSPASWSSSRAVVDLITASGLAGGVDECGGARRRRWHCHRGCSECSNCIARRGYFIATSSSTRSM